MKPIDNVNEHCVTADLGKTIAALRKSPGGIRGINIQDNTNFTESDFLEILKATAHHEYTFLRIPAKLSNSGLIKAFNLMPQGLLLVELGGVHLTEEACQVLTK